MYELERRFYSLLKENKVVFLENWKKKMIVPEDDRFRDYVVSNVEELFSFITSLMNGEKDINDLKPLCEKIAIERAQADGNIGDFVYNVNVGRNEFLMCMYDLNVMAHDLKPLTEKIHICFDTFVYSTVSKYSEIIKSNLEEKKHFINETHKERLTILGQMSASFVHEFRNPLTSVMGFVKLLKADNPQLPYLDIISHELDQLNFRISQFLLVSRKEMWDEKEHFSFNDLFHDIILFLYPSLVNSNVSIEKNMMDRIEFTGYRSEVRQVFLNILMNSIDALESKITSKKIVIDAFESGDLIHITIKNNGPMIPSHKITTIFEPFVTTKKLGTGIGLFVCKQIVEKHNGRIICESSEEWTKFIIAFQKQSVEVPVEQ